MPVNKRRRTYSPDEDNSTPHLDALERLLRDRERARQRLVNRLRRLDQEIDTLHDSIRWHVRYGPERIPSPPQSPQSPPTPDFIETYGDSEYAVSDDNSSDSGTESEQSC